MMYGNYPPGSDLSNAPWWEDYKVPQTKTVNVCVSESLYKSYKLEVEGDESLEKALDRNEWSLETLLKEVALTLDMQLPICDPSDRDHIKALSDACRGWVQEDRAVIEDE